MGMQSYIQYLDEEGQEDVFVQFMFRAVNEIKS